MKEIKAYIKPQMLSKVTMALHGLAGLTGLSVTKVQGFGRGRGKGQPPRIAEDQVEYVPHVRLEVFCRDELADDVVRRIQENAHTGRRGDGKIYVSEVIEAVRISTGKRGNDAI